jgi:hypothetical protein
VVVISKLFGSWAIAGLAMMLAARMAAQVGFQPVSADELRMTREPLAPGAPAIILYRQVDRDDNGRETQDNYLRIKILTEEGRKYANVEIPFLKGSEEVVNLRARTVMPDGSIADFTGEAFEKVLVKARGVRVAAKTFTLPDVRVGCVIEYSYRTIGASGSNWILSVELFTKKAQFSLVPYIVARTPSLSLHWSWQHLPPNTVPPKEGPDHVVRMEAINVPAFQTEEYMPPAGEVMARVDFVYDAGKAIIDPEIFWKRTGKEWNGYLETFLGKPKDMEKAVAQIVSPNDAPEVKLRKIYARVQQIHNTSYDLQKTAQEQKRAKEKPIEKAEDVWKRGYGNNLQLTWLFLGLTRAAGIEAHGCWVADRSEHFFEPRRLQSAQLNLNVVLVKLNGKDLYLDPGVLFAPFGVLAWSETLVQGLRLDADGGTWIRTPLPDASVSRIERVGKLRLSETGDLEGKVTVTYTGLNAMYHRTDLRNADEVARKKNLEDLVTSQIEAPADAELTNHPDWTNSESPLAAEFSLKIANWASNAGTRMVIPVAVFTAGEKEIFEHADRTYPVYFDYPYEKADDITVELPLGWHVNSVPAARNQDGIGVEYALKVEQSQGVLRLTRRVAINTILVERKYYGDLRNLFQAVRASDVSQIIVQPDIHASN